MSANPIEITGEDKQKAISRKPEPSDASQRRNNHQRQGNRSEPPSRNTKNNSQVSNMGTVKILSRVEPKNNANEPNTGKISSQSQSVVKAESNNKAADVGTTKARKILLPFQTESSVSSEAGVATPGHSGKKRSVTENPRQGGEGGHKSREPKDRNSSPRAEHNTQIQSMLAAGAVSQQGIVVTVRADFGFLKPADSPEEVYFRIKDVLSDQAVKVSEGDEMSYFVIKESSKGKLSDRAILLEQLPKGTVKLEVTLAVKVRGHVIQVPRAAPKEEPGKIKLSTPLLINSISIVYVELWQRCLTDGMMCRVGDELEIDVQRYRPENLLFARNVKMRKYFDLFRETGRVKRVVKEGGFAFVRSMNRSNDLYFRLSDVLSEDISHVSNSQVNVEIGTLVTFDVEPDDNFNRGYNSSSGNQSDPSRLKAVRVQLISSLLHEQLQTTSQTVSDFSIFRKLSLHNIKWGVHGTIIRTSERSERSDMYRTFGHIEFSTASALPSVGESFPAEARVSIELLLSIPEVQEMTLSNVTQSRITFFRKLFDELYPQLNCEVEVRGDSEPSEGQVLRVWKLTEQDRLAKLQQKLEGLQVTTPVQVSGNDPNAISRATFCIADLYDPFLSLCPALPIVGFPTTFDLFYDKLENKLIACNVRVEIQKLNHNATSAMKCIGILEYVRKLPNSSSIGIIRHLATKHLYLSYLNSASGSDCLLEVGNIMSFQCSLWGDKVPYAEDLLILPTGNVTPKETLSMGLFVGLVVAEDSVVFVDKCGKDISSASTELDAIVEGFWNVQRMRQQADDSNAVFRQKKMKSKKDEKADDLLEKHFTMLLTAIIQDSGVPLVPPRLLRNPVPVVRHSQAAKMPTSEFLPSSPEVGDMVYCNALYDSSGVSPSPLLAAVNPVKLPLPTVKKLKGLISRIDISLESLGDTASTGALSMLSPWCNASAPAVVRYCTQFCEIRLVDSSLAVSSVAVALATASHLSTESTYFCDIREISCASSGGSIVLPKVGDMVEFYPIDVTAPLVSNDVRGLAVGAQLLPPPSATGSVSDGIHFRPRSSLLVGAVSAGNPSGVVGVLGGSTMAEGPPDNDGATIGFPSNWRSTPVVSCLSWAFLLPHLLIPLETGSSGQVLAANDNQQREPEIAVTTDM